MDACLNGLLDYPEKSIATTVTISKYVVLALCAVNLLKEVSAYFSPFEYALQAYYLYLGS